MFRAPIATALCAVALSFGATLAGAQPYPSKPVRIIVGFPPGQATDIVARLVADKLSARLGQPFIVDNKPGAAGIIGTELTVKAPADGYTLQFSSSGPLAVNPGLYAKLPYDPVRDLQPISLAATVPLFLVVHPSLNANNVKELVALAKSQPGKLNYASGGSGVTNHLVMEMFKFAAGLDMVHVPYKGGPPAITDLIAGQVSLMFETGPGILPHVRSGKLRALGVGSVRRSAAVPELPTIAEQGFPGFDGVAWIGFVAPAGVARAIVDKLSAETAAIIALPDVRERLLALGAEPAASAPDEFGAYIRSEIAKWGKVIRESGAKVE
jgi:tripartite-type tricarboxylate transporter receptor subunit TctC